MKTTPSEHLVTPWRGRLIIGAMLISTFMAAVEVTVISTAMPSIVGQLGGFDLFTWAFGVYLLGQAVMTPIYGRLADQYGRKHVYIGSVMVFLLGSLLCGCAWSMASLIAFRAIQGIGGGGLVPMATTIIADMSRPADRPRLLGYISSVYGIAAIIGPLLGSFFVGTLGWPFVFWVNLPIGLTTIALVAGFLREPARPGQFTPIDLAGAALLALGIGALMATLVQHESFSRTELVLLLSFAVAALAGFALREKRSIPPILPVHLLRSLLIVASNLSGLACGALLIAATAFLPSWIQGVLGGSALVAGLVLGMLTVSWTITSISLSWVLYRLTYRAAALAGSLALIMGTTVLLLGPEHNTAWVVIACVLLGVGLGMQSLVFTVVVQSSVAQHDRGRATALYFFSRLIGQALGAAAFGGVLNAKLAVGGLAADNTLRSLVEPARRVALSAAELVRLTEALAHALHGVFTLATGIAAIGLLIILLIPRQARLQPE